MIQTPYFDTCDSRHHASHRPLQPARLDTTTTLILACFFLRVYPRAPVSSLREAALDQPFEHLTPKIRVHTKSTQINKAAADRSKTETLQVTYTFSNSSMATLQGKTIVVVGGSSGIGFGVALPALRSLASTMITASSNAERNAGAVALGDR